jgi:hypothetical protein
VPALDIALLLGGEGRQLYAWTTSEGGSLKRSVDFVVPYATGEKTRREWVNSTVELDRQRAAAGLPHYQPGMLFAPKDATSALEAASAPPANIPTPVTRAYRARYYHAVTKADDDLGTIYDAALAHLGKNTLFLMASDHGAQWPFAKWNLYDAGIRVPLIVAWPGVVEAGSLTGAMVSWIDILPTLVEAAGGTAPPSEAGAGGIDGRSFLRLLRGERDQHRERIFTTHSGDKEMNVYPMRSVRTRDWKYVWNLHPEFQYTTHVDRAQAEDEVGYWRSWERAAAAGDAHAAASIARYRRRPADELYDLVSDPNELRNLAADPASAERVKAMRAELDAWMRAQGDERRVFDTPVLLDQPAGPAAKPAPADKPMADGPRGSRGPRRQNTRRWRAPARGRAAHAIRIHFTSVANDGGFPNINSPTRNTFAANQTAAYAPAALTTMPSHTCHIGGGLVEVSRSSSTKFPSGGTKLNTVANSELGSRLIGIHRNHGSITINMIGVISVCASRISFTAEPIAAMIDPIVRYASR